ncbi:hypothetical protein AB0M36_16015 [Actinoplanes sp. NPDC051346]|uniref:hypothetical protein n=1 Tax=Actinoplanes sp. NPDC051346 TaxID=3155048 RepID=UPI0034348637
MLDVPTDFPHIFAREGVVTSLASALTGAAPSGGQPTFAVAVTDYFGGVGGNGQQSSSQDTGSRKCET